MKKFYLQVSKGGFRVHGFVQEIGEDLFVSIWGGNRPHIGAVGIAIPRPSLKDPRKWSATSSNFTFVGHKEDLLVKNISEKLAARLRKSVVVTAGLHWDDMTFKEIKTVQNLALKISDKILRKFSSPAMKLKLKIPKI